MNRTKNLNAKHRHSLIPHTVSNNAYLVKPRRASAYPVLENNNMYKPPNNIGPYPIAPMPSLLRQERPMNNTLPPQPPPHQQTYHHHHRKPSAIDLLASAAEYVRTDRKEMSYSRT
jgi:hypothetical protein